MSLVKVSGAQVLYLDQVFDLEVNDSELHLITGANGTGKSTLIKIILGFIKPDFGNVYKTVKKIGYAPELFELPKFIKTINFLEAVGEIKGDYSYLEMARSLDVPINKTLSSLSKGNLQKVNLICAFMGNPKLIILDEPLSGLDLKSQRLIIKMIKNNLDKTSFIISTHESKIFKKHATNILEF